MNASLQTKLLSSIPKAPFVWKHHAVGVLSFLQHQFPEVGDHVGGRLLSGQTAGTSGGGAGKALSLVDRVLRPEGKRKQKKSKDWVAGTGPEALGSFEKVSIFVFQPMASF